MQALSIPPAGVNLYQEFIRSNDLSAGVYRLAVGATDAQQPHREDELYYVLSGRAKFTGGERTVDVCAGSCLFVPANEVHRFHDIVETLEVIVVFGPAEGTREGVSWKGNREDTTTEETR